MGAALVAPARALRAADVSQGRTGADLALLIAAAFVATRAPELVAAGWVGYVEGVGVAFATLVGALSAAVMAEITLLFVGTIALTIAAGSRRSLGRDFDLACVALVPFVAVELATGAVFRVAGGAPRGLVADAVAVVAYGWTAVVLFLAWRQARARDEDSVGASNAAGGEA